MNIDITIDDIKRSAKLFDYGDNKNSNQITDSEIETLLIDCKNQTLKLLDELNIQPQASYNIKRYIILEVIIALGLSNYSDNNKTYIADLKIERDRYFEMIKQNTSKFVASKKNTNMPHLNKGKIFE